MKRATLDARKQFAAQVAERDAMRGSAPLKHRNTTSRQTRFRRSRAGELRALGDILDRIHAKTPAAGLEPLVAMAERHQPGQARFGRLFERSVRLMEIQEQEYVDAYIKVGDAAVPIYVSQETTRAIVADAWSKLEENLGEVNAALNATADEPYERILTLLGAAGEVVRYADVIYTLTPMPDVEDDLPA